MRLFGKKKVKHKAVEINASASTITPIATEEMEPIQSPTAKSRKGTGLLSSLQDPLSTVPTLAMVPKLVHDLASAKETSGEKPAKALRMLFALSEHSSDGENRIQMVRVDGAKIVPVLLDFLNRCARGSSEQYLALLVINNVSIPSENKRVSVLMYLHLLDSETKSYTTLISVEHINSLLPWIVVEQGFFLGYCVRILPAT